MWDNREILTLQNNRVGFESYCHNANQGASLWVSVFESKLGLIWSNPPTNYLVLRTHNFLWVTSTQDTEEKELSYFSSQPRTWALEGGRGREREGTGAVKQLILDMRKQASINRDYSLEQLRRWHKGWLASYQSDRHWFILQVSRSVSFIPVLSLFAGSAAIKSTQKTMNSSGAPILREWGKGMTGVGMGARTGHGFILKSRLYGIAQTGLSLWGHVLLQ